ncbi:hypothetical protein [Bacillus sp. JJ1764]|uniref:hypothetical protein n=1 Tax=Bacillus sp. JJ1764 TaxID=3122964 RepID=UPI003000609B
MAHQKFQSANIKPRYSKGKITVWGTNSVYPRPPWVAAWWSAESGTIFSVLGTIYGFVWHWGPVMWAAWLSEWFPLGIDHRNNSQ